MSNKQKKNTIREYYKKGINENFKLARPNVVITNIVRICRAERHGPGLVLRIDKMKVENSYII